MNPVDLLKAVLCGQDGKCCITGSEADRKVVDEALAALDTAQPERAPLSDAEIEQAVKTHGVSWTGYREDKHGFYTIPILSPYHYQFARAIEAAHGIGTEK